MTGIRVTIIALVSALVVVALVPLAVLLDLSGGGDGFGLCQGGLARCRTSYFDGPELLAILVVVIFLLAIALRAALHVRSVMEQQSDGDRYDPAAPRPGG